MGDTPVPISHAGVVSGALLEAAAEAVDKEDNAAPAYKGVYKTWNNRFQVMFGPADKRVTVGGFTMAEEAARAFDAHARSQGDKVVNFPNAAAGEVQAVKGEASKNTLKRAARGAASGGAASAAPKKRAALAAGAAAALSPAAPSPVKQSPKASGAKAAPRPPPPFHGGPPSALPQPTHPSPPAPPQQPQQQPVLQQPPPPQPPTPTHPPPPAAPLPAQHLGAGHEAPLPLPPPPGASPEEAFIASLSLADPSSVLVRMRLRNIKLAHLVDATRPGMADGLRQEWWRDMFSELGIDDVGERMAMRSALARMQQ